MLQVFSAALVLSITTMLSFWWELIRLGTGRLGILGGLIGANMGILGSIVLIIVGFRLTRSILISSDLYLPIYSDLLIHHDLFVHACSINEG